MGSCKWSLCNFVEGECVTYDIARHCIEGVQHWYCGPISDSVFGEPNTPQQKRQRCGLSNGSVYEATEPAVKASEAAHEATEPVAKASEAAHAQHKDHVFHHFPWFEDFALIIEAFGSLNIGSYDR